MRDNEPGSFNPFSESRNERGKQPSRRLIKTTVGTVNRSRAFTFIEVFGQLAGVSAAV